MCFCGPVWVWLHSFLFPSMGLRTREDAELLGAQIGAILQSRRRSAVVMAVTVLVVVVYGCFTFFGASSVARGS